jgi:hypothetical protein
VAERLKAHAWKVCMRETVSRVRIPPPPPTPRPDTSMDVRFCAESLRYIKASWTIISTVVRF